MCFKLNIRNVFQIKYTYIALNCHCHVTRINFSRNNFALKIIPLGELQLPECFASILYSLALGYLQSILVVEV